MQMYTGEAYKIDQITIHIGYRKTDPPHKYIWHRFTVFCLPFPP